MAPLPSATEGNDFGHLNGIEGKLNLVAYSSLQRENQQAPPHSLIDEAVSNLKLQRRQINHRLQPRSGSSADEAAVVGVILGVVFFVVVLLLVAYIYCWRASSIQRQSSSSRRKEKKRRREKRSKQYHRSEKRRRARRYDRHRRRRSPSSSSSYYDCNKGTLPYFIDTPQYPPYVAQGNNFWHDDGCFNEMDAPQMTYSDDGASQFQQHFGQPQFPLEYFSPARQVYRFTGRRRRSRSCSSYS